MNRFPPKGDCPRSNRCRRLIGGLVAALAAHGLAAVQVERDVPVPMRDGVILRAHVFRPDTPGPYPVLVLRTPYGKGSQADAYVKAGYIVVSPRSARPRSWRWRRVPPRRGSPISTDRGRFPRADAGTGVTTP